MRRLGARAKERLATRWRDAFSSNDREHGTHASRQRQVVADVLIGASEHLTIDEVLELARRVEPALALATVYRHVRLFQQLGLVESHRFGRGPLRFEATTGRRDHDHLVCSACGLIVEFSDPDIARACDAVARGHGLAIVRHRLVLSGLCPTCAPAAR